VDSLTGLMDSIQATCSERISGLHDDSQYLANWQLPDIVTKFTTPIEKIFMPVYLGIYSDEDEEERMAVVFPAEMTPGLERVPLSDGFVQFEKKFPRAVERDMHACTNFEYVSQKVNLLTDKTNLIKTLQFGTKYLVDQGYCDDEMRQRILKKVQN
jgi:hypothetical protein